jgi:glycosyltransferase involved in cell wall biosynthesis
MTHPFPHISVCICTFRRPLMLARLLDKLSVQQTEGRFTFGIVVADDDSAQSARDVVRSFSERSDLDVVYCCDPRGNIALARNNTLRRARGEYVAFVDDDEFPQPDWLLRLIDACEGFAAAGILGPVRPHFEASPPAWLIKGRFCERAEHETGHVMRGDGCRTGNVLFRRSMIAGDDAPFQTQFGAGGEDKDFFMRMEQQGHVFRWCNEAVVHETVPPQRWTRRYLLQRALVRGHANLKIPGRRVQLVATSLVAAPIYSLILPFALLAGQHVFMNYCIRLCDHAGRLLGMVGFTPASIR